MTYFISGLVLIFLLFGFMHFNVSFVFYFPEDGHMVGRNMYQVLVYTNYRIFR